MLLTTALQGDVQFHLEHIGESSNATFNIDAECSSDEAADVIMDITEGIPSILEPADT